jgi:DNA polymerase-3 subunit delta'
LNLYKDKKLPNKILLSGEKGIGKSTLDTIMFHYILSIDEDHSYSLKILRLS